MKRFDVLHIWVSDTPKLPLTMHAAVLPRYIGPLNALAIQCWEARRIPVQARPYSLKGQGKRLWRLDESMRQWQELALSQVG